MMARCIGRMSARGFPAALVLGAAMVALTHHTGFLYDGPPHPAILALLAEHGFNESEPSFYEKDDGDPDDPEGSVQAATQLLIDLGFQNEPGFVNE